MNSIIEERERKYWKPKINEELMGVLTDKKENIGKYHSKFYVITTQDSVDICIWGKVQLNSIMEAVKIGDKIILRYVGNEKTKDEYRMKRYELEILNND